MDCETDRVLYAKNPNLRLLPASTAKLVTAMVALDRLSADSVVVVGRNAAWTPSVSPRLRPGQKLFVRDLLHLALMRSINGATVALAEAVAGSEEAFARMMNEKAASLGAVNTRFVNASGLPGPGQYITAHDLARIMKASLGYDVIRQIISTREIVLDADGRNYHLRNTNRLLWAEDDIIGGKTGFTRAARHCLTFAASKGGCTLVGSILGEPYRDLLFSNAENLLSQGYLIAQGLAAPEIYMNAPESPVVYASYDKPKIKKKVRSKKRLVAKSKTRKKYRAARKPGKGRVNTAGLRTIGDIPG
jgi:D-alanyl-D-alanine carboxypeptidase (penicillin-binding protein 5/6)